MIGTMIDLAALAFELRVLMFVAGFGTGAAVSTAIGLQVGAIPYEEVRAADRIPPQQLPVIPAKE